MKLRVSNNIYIYIHLYSAIWTLSLKEVFDLNTVTEILKGWIIFMTTNNICHYACCRYDKDNKISCYRACYHLQLSPAGTKKLGIIFFSSSQVSIMIFLAHFCQFSEVSVNPHRLFLTASETTLGFPGGDTSLGDSYPARM